MAVKQEFTGDSSNLRAEYQKIQRENAKLLEQNQKLAREAANAHNSTKAAADSGRSGIERQNEALGQSISRLSQMALGYASVEKGISVVNAALQEQARLQQQALTAMRGRASSQTDAIFNVPAAERPGFIKEMGKIDRDTGFGNPNQLIEAGSNVYSATENSKLTYNIMREVAPLLRHRPERLEESAGAVADVATIIGDKEGKDSTAIVASLLGTARVNKMDAFKYLAQGIAAGTTYDTGKDRVRAAVEVGAVESAVTRAIKDPEGRVSSHAAIQLEAHLQRFLPEKDILDERGKVLRKGTGLTNLRQRIEAVQADETLQRGFFEGQKETRFKRSGRHLTREEVTTFEKATFEDKPGALMKELLTNKNSAFAKDVSRLYTEVKPDRAALKQMQDDMRSLNGAQGLATADVELEGVQKRFDATRVSAAKAALAKKAGRVISEVTTPEGPQQLPHFVASKYSEFILGSRRFVNKSDPLEQSQDYAKSFEQTDEFLFRRKPEDRDAMLETLKEIRDILERAKSADADGINKLGESLDGFSRSAQGGAAKNEVGVQREN